MYDEINRHRSIKENISALIDSSDGQEDMTLEETTESNPFVKHFKVIERRVVHSIGEDEDTEIKNAFYNPVAWKQFMSNWVPKIPMWTALALGDLGRHGTSEVYEEKIGVLLKFMRRKSGHIKNY